MTNKNIKYTVCFEYYTPELCKANPNKLWVFGDNLLKTGKGGQAIIRDEPNALGIPTKVYPSQVPDSFFSDDPVTLNYLKHFYDEVFDELVEYSDYSSTIVFPAQGLGTGLSEMPERAPLLLAFLDGKISELLGEDYTKYRD